MGINGHAESHGGGGGVPDANGTSEHYHVAEDDQTLEQVYSIGGRESYGVVVTPLIRSRAAVMSSVRIRTELKSALGCLRR